MRERKADRQKNHTIEAATNDAADNGPAIASDLSLEEEVRKELHDILLFRIKWINYKDYNAIMELFHVIFLHESQF